VLHDPVWYDHLPYLPFPDDWPVFTPKDKMGDWLEAYVKIMELRYWTNSECKQASYDPESGTWTVQIERDGKSMTLHPHQLVFATGAYGAPKMADIPIRKPFIGSIIHTSQYRSGSEYSGKKCVVIGSASSAHDVAADLWENGGKVTMVQRSPSIVVRSESLMKFGFEGLYSESAVEAGMDVDKADMLGASVPYRLIPEFQKPVYDAIAEQDAEFYQELTNAGFIWDFGEDNSGLMAKAMRTASGYYIDVGACALIIDGRIGIKSGAEIEAVVENGLAMSDGTIMEADVVIHATGYKSLDDTIARLISPEVSKKVGKFWGYGSGITGDPGPYEGELRNMWKPTEQQALWFHGGNLALSRQFSKYLALQLKARLEGIDTPVYNDL
jgi:putative flavoprotein involved in K+ transport